MLKCLNHWNNLIKSPALIKILHCTLIWIKVLILNATNDNKRNVSRPDNRNITTKTGDRKHDPPAWPCSV